MIFILLFAFLSYFSTYAINETLEQAILDNSVEAVEKILKSSNSLSDWEKHSYADLAQHLVDNMTMEMRILEIKDRPESPFLAFGAIGLVAIPIFAVIYFNHDYKYDRDGIKPILITAFSAIIGLACLIKGNIDEEASKFKRKKIIRDLLKIKQLIYSDFTQTNLIS
jgi:hypothetical protein